MDISTILSSLGAPESGSTKQAQAQAQAPSQLSDPRGSLAALNEAAAALKTAGYVAPQPAAPADDTGLRLLKMAESVSQSERVILEEEARAYGRAVFAGFQDELQKTAAMAEQYRAMAEQVQQQQAPASSVTEESLYKQAAASASATASLFQQQQQQAPASSVTEESLYKQAAASAGATASLFQQPSAADVHACKVAGVREAIPKIAAACNTAFNNGYAAANVVFPG